VGNFFAENLKGRKVKEPGSPEREKWAVVLWCCLNTGTVSLNTIIKGGRGEKGKWSILWKKKLRDWERRKIYRVGITWSKNKRGKEVLQRLSSL